MAHNLSLAPADLLGRLGHTLRQGDLALALGMIGILVVLIRRSAACCARPTCAWWSAPTSRPR